MLAREQCIYVCVDTKNKKHTITKVIPVIQRVPDEIPRATERSVTSTKQDIQQLRHKKCFKTFVTIFPPRIFSQNVLRNSP